MERITGRQTMISQSWKRREREEVRSEEKVRGENDKR